MNLQRIRVQWASLQSIAEAQPTFNQFNSRWFSVSSSIGESRFKREKAVRRIISPAISNFYLQLTLSNGKMSKRDQAIFIHLLQQEFLKLLRTAYLFGIESAYQSLGFYPQFSTAPKFRLPISIESSLKIRARQSATFFVLTSLNLLRLKKFQNVKKRIYRWRGWRLSLVANREFGFAYSQARWDVFFNSKISRKRWICVYDDRTRDEHLINARVGWIPLNQKFPSGVFSPGIRDKDSFGCRCSLEPSFMDFRVDNLWVGG